MMNRRTMILILIAIALISLSAWIHLGSSDQQFRTPALTASELQALKPDLDGDMRLMEELRRQAGREPDSWKELPPSGKTIYLTLWAEEVHRTTTWSQQAAGDGVTPGSPELDEVAAAYETLGQHETASAIRALEKPFEQVRSAFQTWFTGMKDGKTAPRPSTKALETAANAAFARLATIRPLRLEHVRAHAAELGIR